MRVEVRLPQWSMGMQEATVTEWLKAVGDPVAEGEDLVELDSGKLVQAVPAPATGVLAEIQAEAGELVPVRELLAVIESAGEGA